MNEGRDVRPLTADDAAVWTEMIGNAYPVMDLHTREAREAQAERIRQRLDEPTTNAPTTHWYGVFEDDTLLGGMRLHDFQMTCFETPLLVGGVGMVAVDLAHKKEHVARDLIAFYLRHYRERGAPLGDSLPVSPGFLSRDGIWLWPEDEHLPRRASGAASAWRPLASPLLARRRPRFGGGPA